MMKSEVFQEFLSYRLCILHPHFPLYHMEQLQDLSRYLFSVPVGWHVLLILKEKKTQSKCMFRLGDDDIESPYKKFLVTFDFFV